jgi:hypothetical protein
VSAAHEFLAQEVQEVRVNKKKSSIGEIFISNLISSHTQL